MYTEDDVFKNVYKRNIFEAVKMLPIRPLISTYRTDQYKEKTTDENGNEYSEVHIGTGIVFNAVFANNDKEYDQMKKLYLYGLNDYIEHEEGGYHYTLYSNKIPYKKFAIAFGHKDECVRIKKFLEGVYDTIDKFMKELAQTSLGKTDDGKNICMDFLSWIDKATKEEMECIPEESRELIQKQYQTYGIPEDFKKRVVYRVNERIFHLYVDAGLADKKGEEYRNITDLAIADTMDEYFELHPVESIIHRRFLALYKQKICPIYKELCLQLHHRIEYILTIERFKDEKARSRMMNAVREKTSEDQCLYFQKLGSAMEDIEEDRTPTEKEYLKSLNKLSQIPETHEGFIVPSATYYYIKKGN